MGKSGKLVLRRARGGAHEHLDTICMRPPSVFRIGGGGGKDMLTVGCHLSWQVGDPRRVEPRASLAQMKLFSSQPGAAPAAT